MAVKIWIGYTLLSCLLLGVKYRKDVKQWLVCFTLVSALPVIGWLLPMFWPEAWHRKWKESDRSEQLDVYAGYVPEQNELSEIYKVLEPEKEKNIISIEEALLVNDHATRRKVIIDLLKEDSMEYLEVLQQAVNNEDTETSHYAVSAIVEAKRKLTNAMQDLAVRYEENKDDPHVLEAYAEVLKGYSRSGFLDPRSLYKYKYTYSSVLGQLIEVSPAKESAYSEKVNADLELNDFVLAERYARLYLERYPQSETAFLLLLKVYYHMRSFEKLKETLGTLKQSSIRLSNKGLTIVRYWVKEA